MRFHCLGHELDMHSGWVRCKTAMGVGDASPNLTGGLVPHATVSIEAYEEVWASVMQGG